MSTLDREAMRRLADQMLNAPHPLCSLAGDVRAALDALAEVERERDGLKVQAAKDLEAMAIFSESEARMRTKLAAAERERDEADRLWAADNEVNEERVRVAEQERDTARAQLAAEKKCTTCGGDPTSHPSGKRCVCGDGTRNGETDGLRLAVIDLEGRLVAAEDGLRVLREAAHGFLRIGEWEVFKSSGDGWLCKGPVDLLRGPDLNAIRFTTVVDAVAAIARLAGKGAAQADEAPTSWDDPRLANDPNKGRTCMLCGRIVPAGTRYTHGPGYCVPAPPAGEGGAR